MKRQHLRHLISSISIIVIMAALLSSIVQIDTARAAEWLDEDIIEIGPDEQINGDLFLSRPIERLIIAGTVRGDVFGYAKRVEITGTVEGDVNLAGEEISISGVVEDDVRTGFISTYIGPDAEIKGDLTGVGFNLVLAKTSTLKGDLWYAGYQADIAGTVGGALHFDGVALALNGTVAGDVEARVESPDTLKEWSIRFDTEFHTIEILTPGLSIGNHATLGGNLDYTSPTAFDLPEKAIEGNITHTFGEATHLAATLNRINGTIHFVERRGWFGTGVLVWLFLFAGRLISFVVLGGLILWRMPRTLRIAAIQLRTHSISSIALGATSLILIPALVLLVGAAITLVVLSISALSLGGLAGPAISLGTLGIGSLTTVVYIIVGFIAPLVVAYTLGEYILARATKGRQWRRIITMLAGVGIYVCMWQLPIIGECMNCLSVLFGVGALLLYWRVRKRPDAAIMPKEEEKEAKDDVLTDDWLIQPSTFDAPDTPPTDGAPTPAVEADTPNIQELDDVGTAPADGVDTTSIEDATETSATSATDETPEANGDTPGETSDETTE